MADQVIDGAQRFVKRCLRVVAVAVKDIDIVMAQPLQARVYLLHDMLSRQAAVVGTFSHWPERFRRQHVGFPWISFQRFAHQFLCCSFFIYIGRIEEVNPQIVGRFDGFLGIFTLDVPAVG
ncbi:hypothetical protein D3C81_661850 [compost metagenome]